MATGRVVDLWHRKDRTRTARYGKGKRWQAVWTDNKGTETKRSFDYKDKAQAWIDMQVTESTLNPYGLKPDMLFQDFWEMWRAQQMHQRPASQRQMDTIGKKYLKPTFGDKYLREITRYDIQVAVNAWSEEVAASTLRLYYAYARQVFREAVLQKILAESPCVKISLPEVEQKAFAFSDEVLKQLLDTAPEPFSTAMRVGAATGLRPSELIGLSKQDVDFQRGVIHVRLQDASKRHGGVLLRAPLKTRWSKRDISFGPQLRKILMRLCKNAGPEGRLFHEDGTVQIWHFQDAWVKAREVVPEIGPGWHQLRHYHASVLISSGFSPVAVAARLGHKDATETLRTYAHLWHTDNAEMAQVADTVVAA